MFIYILPQISLRNLSNFIDDFQNTLAQGKTQKFILEAMVLLLIVYFTLLFIELVLIIIWKLLYNLWRRRKLGAFKDRLARRKLFVAIHATTGQKHSLYAIDLKHAKDILKKTGATWTIFTEDKR